VNGLQTELSSQTHNECIAVGRRLAFDTKLSWLHKLWRVAQKGEDEY
jgi:hypothetical protein